MVKPIWANITDGQLLKSPRKPFMLKDTPIKCDKIERYFHDNSLKIKNPARFAVLKERPRLALCILVGFPKGDFFQSLYLDVIIFTKNLNLC